MKPDEDDKVTKRGIGATLLLLLVLAACTDFVDHSQPHPAGVPAGEITADHTVGQTFIARHDGLNGIEVLLATYARLNSEPVVFHLRLSPESTSDLRTMTISASDMADNDYYLFAFDPVRDSNGQQFYYFLNSPTSTSGNAITAWLGSWDSYQDGSAYIAGRPEEAQTVFRLHYASGWMGLGALETLFSTGLKLLPAVLLFLLPGLALTLSALPHRQIDWRMRLSLAPACGLAIYPVILAWSLPIGVRPGAPMVWVVLVLSAAVLLVRYRHLASGRRPARVRSAWRAWWESEERASDLVTLVVLGLILITLFVPIQGFVAPLWDDSVQHAVIAQRIYENGGLFDSWEPYAPYRTMTTHFGFHAAVAAYMWLTGGHVAPAMLLIGQVVNLVGALGLYGLSRYASRDRWSGTTTLIIVSLFSIIPATYTNWGRYPQLTGQAILPGAVCLLWALGEGKQQKGRSAVLVGLVLTGMTLSYYRTPFLFAAFVAAWLAFQAIPAWVKKRRDWRRDLIWLSVAALALAVMLGPWIVFGLRPFQQVSGSNTAQSQAARSTPAITPDESSPGFDLEAAYGPWLQNPDYRWLLLGALAAALLVLVGRRWRVATWIGWLIGFLLLPPIPLQYTRGPAFLFSIMIGIYLPAGLLIGSAIGTITEALLGHIPKLVRLLVVLVILGGSAYGAMNQMRVLDYAYTLVTPADLKAMDWIRENSPRDAKFLINGIVYTDGYSVVGGDAGWWLPIYTQRANSIPPQYALFTAQPIEPGYTQQVYNLVHTLLAHPPSTPEGMQALCDFGITHIYIGQRRGMAVAALPLSIRPEKPMLDVAELTASELFDLQYQHDRVRVFQFDRGACTQ
jgi:flagellar biosynthesis protein FliQ